MPMIEVRNLRKSYGRLKAVDDVSFDVKKGEIFGLLGPNGAGKTTTLNILVGVLSPNGGAVRLFESGPPSDTALRSRVGIAPQSLAIYEELSAEENLTFFAKIYGLSAERVSQRVNWALDLVALRDRRGDRASRYSGGMKRRLNLAAALVHDPELLFLDEPSVGVDPQSRNAIFESILKLKAEGLTVIYTTHYMEEAERLCDRVAIMDSGRILDADTVPRLIERYGGGSAIIFGGTNGEERIETADPIGKLIELRAARELRDFRVERPNLEQVFLKLTGKALRDA